MDSLRETLAAGLAALDAAGLRRHSRAAERGPGPRVRLDGRELLCFGSNDYLGLAGDPRLAAAMAEVARHVGAGAGGSRLTTGERAAHRMLERELAELKQAEAALLFPSGYQAALGTVPALVERGDLVLSDALNHACLIDACRLSRAEVRVYRHRDAEHAAGLLADRGRFRRALLVTDGVFSMDGDLAPLPELCDLCESADTWLMVDDAHGTGVLGARGSGTAEHLGAAGRVPVQMGTLSKALGTQGGFIAGSRELIEWLRNRARTFVYSTAVAPPLAAAALAALAVVQEEPERRRHLASLSRRLRSGLRSLRLAADAGETPVVPVIAGESAAAIALAAALEARGFRVPAIRPPTVPSGAARLRISLSAAHTAADVDALLAALADSWDETQVRPPGETGRP